MAKKKKTLLKYILIYHAPPAAMGLMMNATPEEQEEGFKPWLAWAQKCGNHLLDMGAPFTLGLKLDKSGVKELEPAGDLITGYSFMQAENIDVIKKLVENHPHINWTDGCWAEIHELMPIQF